jgi:hypothetical protein
MNGLPSDIDLSFLVGQELQQVCIGRHEAILHFGDAVSICIESEIGHKSNLGKLTAIYKTIAPSASMLVSLINSSIVKAYAESPGTLVLELCNGQVLEIYDANSEYESYQISYDNRVIVV